MTREERETIIRWDATPDPAIVFTCEKKWARKLQRYGFRPVLATVGANGEEHSWEYLIPKNWFTVRPPRILSAAQKKASVSNIRKAISAKKEAVDSRNLDGKVAGKGMGAKR